MSLLILSDLPPSSPSSHQSMLIQNLTSSMIIQTVTSPVHAHSNFLVTLWLLSKFRYLAFFVHLVWISIAENMKVWIRITESMNVKRSADEVQEMKEQMYGCMDVWMYGWAVG
jgi:hypothetical protein